MLIDNSFVVFLLLFLGLYILCLQNFLSTFIHVPQFIGVPPGHIVTQPPIDPPLSILPKPDDTTLSPPEFDILKKQKDLLEQRVREQEERLKQLIQEQQLTPQHLQQPSSSEIDELHGSLERLDYFDVKNWYKHYQKLYEDTLSEKIPPKVIVYECGPSHGLGNKFPGVVTAFAFALVTNRLFFIAWRDSTFEYGRAFAPPGGIEMDWSKGRRLLKLPNPPRDFVVDWDARGEGQELDSLRLLSTENFSEYYSKYDIVTVKCNDYPMPVLSINPNYAPYFRKNKGLFMFGDLGSIVMNITPELQAQVDEFKEAHFKKLTIGIQIRTKKHYRGLDKPAMETYFRLARLLQQQHGVTDDEVSFFVTTDEPQAFQIATAVLGSKNVWHTDFHPRRTLTGDLMAVVDMKLLSLCDELVISHGSSFGQVAAAWTKKMPYSVASGDTYWGASVSEPCYWNVRNALKVPQIRDNQPPVLAMHHLLCHPNSEVWGD